MILSRSSSGSISDCCGVLDIGLIIRKGENGYGVTGADKIY